MAKAMAIRWSPKLSTELSLPQPSQLRRIATGNGEHAAGQTAHEGEEMTRSTVALALAFALAACSPSSDAPPAAPVDGKSMGAATIADMRTARGRRIEGRGVIPDEKVPLRPKKLFLGQDPTVDKALKWLQREAMP